MNTHPGSVTRKAIAVGLTVGLLTLGLGVSALANAGSGHQAPEPTPTAGTPGDMRLGISADETIDTDGTQGNFESSTQGTKDSDGDQDTSSTGSFEAVPQKW